MPFVAVAPVDSVDEGLELANDNIYGLTAGFFSEDRAEIATLPRHDRGRRRIREPARRSDYRSVAGHPAVRWLEGARARPARPGGGLYYVQQFMREQSQTVVD